MEQSGAGAATGAPGKGAALGLGLGPGLHGNYKQSGGELHRRSEASLHEDQPPALAPAPAPSLGLQLLPVPLHHSTPCQANGAGGCCHHMAIPWQAVGWHRTRAPQCHPPPLAWTAASSPTSSPPLPAGWAPRAGGGDRQGEGRRRLNYSRASSVRLTALLSPLWVLQPHSKAW